MSPGLCDPKSWSEKGEPSSPRSANTHTKSWEPRSGPPTSVPLLSWSPLSPVPDPGKCCSFSKATQRTASPGSPTLHSQASLDSTPYPASQDPRQALPTNSSYTKPQAAALELLTPVHGCAQFSFFPHTLSRHLQCARPFARDTVRKKGTKLPFFFKPS